MPYQKIRVNVKVPHKSGSNMSHRNTGTMFVGTLYPLLVEEVIPGTRCSLKVNEVVQLPPLVSDTYMNLRLKLEAFFVPMRILCKSFSDWYCDYNKRLVGYTVDAAGGVTSVSGTYPQVMYVGAALPWMVLRDTLPSSVYGPGSLLDYLGFNVGRLAQDGQQGFSPLSIVAYHMIYNRYYRNARVQNEVFAEDIGSSTSPNDGSSGQALSKYQTHFASFPYLYFHYGGTMGTTVFDDNHVIVVDETNYNRVLADGSNFFALRQRNFGFDYFTGARPSAQQGSGVAVQMDIPAGATSSMFTVQQLRAANSLQQFRERNNLVSPIFKEQNKARYGVDLSEGVAQNPLFIGQASYDVVSRGVDQTGSVSEGASPFNSVGAQYGRGYGFGSDYLIEDFTALEPGFIMVIQSLVPEVSYSSGISPYLLRYSSQGSIVEMANPLLQNVGDEPIPCLYLTDEADGNNSIFGYQDRYGTFQYHRNEIHGQFRDGQSLSQFVLQRSFDGLPVIGNEFLKIPTDYLDSALVVKSDTIGASAWYDAKLEWKISHPLAEFSMPSLQNPGYEHGENVSLIRNGQIF